MMKIRDGLIIGILTGILDVLVFKFILDVPVSTLDALGAVTFWMAAGLLTHTSNISIPATIKGVLVAVVMGVPWIVDAINRDRMEHIGILSAIFLFYGAVVGFSSGRVERRIARAKY